MKNIYEKIIFCSILFLIFSSPGFGQTDEYMFRCSLKDKSGKLWFSSPGNGIYCFNAASDAFANFTKADGLNANNVEYITEDKAGNLWFGTEYGVCRYDGKSFTDMSEKAGLCKYDINCIIEDSHGNIWVASNGWGISRYNPGSGEVKNFTKDQGLGSNGVQCLLEDKAGNLWCGERGGGVCRYDTTAGRFIKVNSDGCFSSQIMDIKEDREGNIWFANLYDGVCRYNVNPSDGHAVITHFTEENGLCDNVVKCIFEDKKGNLWFACGDSKFDAGAGSLCRYTAGHPGGQAIFTGYSTKDGLTNSNVWSIVEDDDGNIWVGTRNGLYRYHSASGRFIDYTHKAISSN